MRRLPSWIFALLAAVTPPAAYGQADSVTVTAGNRYGAGPLHSFFLGSGYRHLWTAPIRVPVLRPDTFAGGLTFLEEGTGLQTRSLRFAGADGYQYVFRSVDKNQSGGLHPDLRGTIVNQIVQDQIAAKHPGAALVVAPLLAAAGVLHATPTLAVMADHAILGEHRAEFAGMLGIIEVRPADAEDGGRFRNFQTIEGTEGLLEELAESPETRVDARAYLTARLMDLFVGDWDRHMDQWRWALQEGTGSSSWLPIPRDRDNAFYSVEGIIGTVGRAIRPFVLQFDDRYGNLYGLTYNGQQLDRMILPELPRSVWDSLATHLQTRLTDEVIQDAVQHLPREYYALDGQALESALRSRRDSLAVVADEFYLQLVRDVEVHGTDAVEQAEIERRPDGYVAVRLSSSGSTFFDRVFVPGETREIRVNLRGGDDQAIVTGSGPEVIRLRVLGGAGNDRLEDRLAPGAGRALFFDSEGENAFIEGPATHVDARTFAPPERDTLTENNRPPPRDWGETRSLLVPVGQWRSDIGPVIGFGPVFTRYGFRRFPFARQTSLALLYAPLETRFEIAGEVRRIRTGGDFETRLSAHVSDMSLTRFHGFGNDSPQGEIKKHNDVWATEIGGEAVITKKVGSTAQLGLGPIAAYLEPALVEGSPADLIRPAGSSSFGVAGASLRGELDGRDHEGYPRRGFRIRLTGEGYPVVWGDAPEAFLRGEGIVAAYVPLPLPLEPTIALRARGERVWGDAPFQYAASIGGGSTIRGYRRDRFVGDTAVSGTAELRARLFRANLLVAKGDLGVLGLAEAGRVYVDGESSGGWHQTTGGGLWFGAVERNYTAHLLLIEGDGLRISAGVGVPF
jgi:hypothetical protein